MSLGILFSFRIGKCVQRHTVTTNGFVVVGSFRGRQRPNRRKKGSVYRGFGRRRCFCRRFGVKARRTRRKHRHSFTSLTLFSDVFGGNPQKKGTTFKTASDDDFERRRGRGGKQRRVVEVVSKRRCVFGRRVSRCRGETCASEIESK